MNEARRLLAGFALIGCVFFSPAAAGDARIARTQRTLQPDLRVIADRLNSANNPDHRDESFLNAVGAVWSYAVGKNGAGYAASTGERAASGFLIDRCHVLTNLHVAYGDTDVVNPPLARRVTFAVGQTKLERDRGALQGLKFLTAGTVAAHGDAMVIDGLVHHPEADWALIRLDAEVDPTITPLTIAAVDRSLLAPQVPLGTAGYPADHRERRGDGFRLKDLWVSEGRVVAVMSAGSGALLETTLQTTPGSSGGPVYGDFNGQRHVVIGIVQSMAGNGIDVSSTPNVQILFTPGTYGEITRAQAQAPCR